MKLRRLTLKSFRKFDSKAVEFEDGVNIVYGANELGKTTILLALFHVLFTDAKTRSAKIFEEIQSWNSSLLPIIELEFESEGEKFSLIRDFDAKRQELRQGNKILSDDPAKISEYIKEHMGIADSEVYKLTALIEQSDLAAVGSGDKNLQESIQESLTGSENVSVNEVLKKLKKRITDYTKGLSSPAKIPGTIKALGDEKEMLESKLEAVRDYLSKYSTSSEDEQDLSKEITGTEKKISELEMGLQLNEVREKLEQRLFDISKQVKEKESQIRDIARLQDQEKEKELALKNMEKGQDLSKMKEELSTINVLLKEKKTNLQSLQVSEKEEDSSNVVISLGVLLTSAILGIAVFAIGILFSFQILVALSIALILALVPVVYSMFAKSPSSVPVGESQVAKLEKEIASLSSKRQKIFEQSDASSEREFLALSDKVGELVKDLENVKASLSSLTKQKPLEEIEKEQTGLLAEKKEIEGKLTDEVKASNLSSVEKVKYQKLVDGFKIKLRELIEKQSMAKAVIRTSEYSYDDLVETEEKLEDVRSDLEHAKEKARVFAYVSKYITVARDEVISSSGEVIARGVQDLLPLLTNGRYSKVRVDSELNLEVFSEEKEDWVVPDQHLSSGTVDQIYFVARIAILSLICKDQKPPLILDDPFVTFDSSRREGARNMLENISNNYQVILFTCHDDYNSWGKLVKL